MTTEIVEEKEIEIGGETAVIRLLKINKAGVIYFRVSGRFKNYITFPPVNPLLNKLREKYK